MIHRTQMNFYPRKMKNNTVSLQNNYIYMNKPCKNEITFEN